MVYAVLVCIKSFQTAEKVILAKSSVSKAIISAQAKINNLNAQEKFQKAVTIGGAERSGVELIGAG